jgi:hypothetical protein
VRVSQPGSRLRLAIETFSHFARHEDFRPGNFEGNTPIQLMIVREQHDPQPAAPKLAKDFKSADLEARRIGYLASGIEPIGWMSVELNSRQVFGGSHLFKVQQTIAQSMKVRELRTAQSSGFDAWRPWIDQLFVVGS